MPWRIAACLFLLLSYLFAQAPAGRVTPPEILNLKRIPTEKEIPGGGRHRSPIFVQMPQGPLHAYSLRTVHGVTEEVIQTSTDDGRTWSTPVTAFKLPAGFGDVGAPKLLLDSRGQIHLFMPVNPRRTAGDYHQQQWNLWYVRSTDAPFHWAAPKEIWKGYVGSLQSAIQLRSGRIVLPFCFLTQRSWSNRGSGPDAFTYTGKFSSSVLYSDDGGDSWIQSTELKTPTPDITTILGAIEPVVLELRDGRVWMLIRTQMGRFYESFSADGAEWSRPRPSEIISSDSPAGLIRLKDGRILLIWNNCLRFPYAYGGRHVLHAAVSEDEGRSWRGYREILRDPSRDRPPLPSGDFGVSYSLPALLNDGKAIFGFGYYRDIPAVLLDPRWLYATSQHADFSTGLDEWSTFGTRGVEIVPHPQRSGARVLSLRKPEADWPAAAVWNFPAGGKGSLSLRLLLKPGFRGASLGLTDHFSVPFDLEDRIFNLVNLKIGPNGELANGKSLGLGRWHQLKFDWDTSRYQCRVMLDGHQIQVVPLTRMSRWGVSYLRIRSTAESTDDAGLLVESVEADTSLSW